MGPACRPATSSCGAQITVSSRGKGKAFIFSAGHCYGKPATTPFPIFLPPVRLIRDARDTRARTHTHTRTGACTNVLELSQRRCMTFSGPCLAP